MANKIASVLPVAPQVVETDDEESKNPSVPATVTITGNTLTITAQIGPTAFHDCKVKEGRKATGSKYVTLAIGEVLMSGWRMSGTANVFLRPPRKA